MDGAPVNEIGLFHQVLDRARRELLDLSARNRLLHTPRGTGRSSRLEIVGERSAHVFDYLVNQRRKMYFAARPAAPPASDSPKAPQIGEPQQLSTAEEPRPHAPISPDETGETPVSAGELTWELPQPEADSSPQADQGDNKLQTTLPSEQLQYRLRRLASDARTYEEELGVNILYLALGFLKWFETDRPHTPRYAPLILVPVSLKRTSATARFSLEYRDDEIATNLSLQSRLAADFGITLPDIPSVDDLNPEDYYAAVRRAAGEMPNWEVLENDIVLWFFSYNKFLIYRDLDPAQWPEHARLEAHPLLATLLGTRPASWKPVRQDGWDIDQIPARDWIHVLDADSSQIAAIEDVKAGCHLVIQGPPGTGKSQTIANLIAASVAAGKKVLFVAEKLAALEVVQRRLAQLGLGEVALELHSHKASKRLVLEQLRRTLDLPAPQRSDLKSHFERLDAVRRQLNEHLELLHSPVASSERTPHELMGQLLLLGHQGVRPADLPVGPVQRWSSQDAAARQEALHDLAAAAQQLGHPARHPWRGVERDYILPSDVERLVDKVRKLIPLFDRWQQAAMQLAAHWQTRPPRTFQEADQLIRFSALVSEFRDFDQSRLADPVWEQSFDEVQRLVSAGKRWQMLRRQRQNQVKDEAWREDWSSIRQELARLGECWHWFVHPSYYRATNRVRTFLKPGVRCNFAEKLALLDDLIEAKQQETHIGSPEAERLGGKAFGRHWNGLQSDWEHLEKILDFYRRLRELGIQPELRRAVAALSPLPQPPDTRVLAEVHKELGERVQECFEAVRLDVARVFGTTRHDDLAVESVRSYLAGWIGAATQVDSWIQYRLREKRAEELGLAPWCRALVAGTISADRLVSTWQASYAEALLRVAFEERPQLARFSAAEYEQRLEEFCRLDRQRLEYAVQQVQQAHRQALPRTEGALGEMAVLSRELAKKTRHLPLRRLLAEAGRVIQQIKPVFMMSPLSVAQYLEPGAVEFDLLLIDEASQIEPVDALGAVARCRQMVVVGDSKQLPPTAFFQRLASHEEVELDAAQTAGTADLESILSLCLARQMPSRMLRWHYRSRHHSLIAVSNREFYDKQLLVVPNPVPQSAGLGLSFRYVPDGRYDRGRSATNRIEARCVAEAVMQHARQFPHLSLGVGTLGLPQRDAIEDEIERLRRQQPECEAFFALDKAEPFFVKNLENIQGDERDVIFISIGYGPDQNGDIHYHFGPVSQEGGERRLNVLMTRARQRCVVFSSLKAEQIDLSRATGIGPRVLKAFLECAEHGAAHEQMIACADGTSNLDRYITERLSEQGYQAAARVGLAGVYVELAVRDRAEPERFLLGIDLDGPTRGALASARDRERIRPALLMDRGWKLYRSWSLDWYRRPDEELGRLLQAVRSQEDPGSEPGGSDSAAPQGPPDQSSSMPGFNGSENPTDRSPSLPPRQSNSPPQSHAATHHDRGDPGAPRTNVIKLEPYRVAVLRLRRDSLVKAVRRGNLKPVRRWVNQVVAVEGPVHGDEVARRLAQACRMRLGGRLRQAVALALEELTRRGTLRMEGEFYWVASAAAQPPLRNRNEVPVASLRDARAIPPAEVAEVLHALARVYVGITEKELVEESARLLGVSGSRTRFRQLVRTVLELLLREGRLVERQARYYAG
ncbi:MAG: hypothetical protein KatS3mg110_2394 [Pirellulaceae bacterium]|nr:MAG: hypothetical protein KatS3mg110_2394 [Pirellulaceae bacterium]